MNECFLPLSVLPLSVLPLSARLPCLLSQKILIYMKILLHQFSTSSVIAIYTNPTPISLYLTDTKAIDTHSAPQKPILDLNYGSASSARPSEASNLNPKSEMGDKLSNIVAVKVVAILDGNRAALSSSLSLSQLLDIHEQRRLQQHALNHNDFTSYYQLLVSCGANLFLDEKSVHHCKAYCVALLDPRGDGKIHFYYSPMEGVKSLLLTLDLCPALSASDANVSLLADLHEQATQSADLYTECREKLIATQKEAQEIGDKYEELVGKVEVRETQLFMQFTLLLNEKKKKIRELIALTDQQGSEIEGGEMNDDQEG